MQFAEEFDRKIPILVRVKFITKIRTRFIEFPNTIVLRVRKDINLRITIIKG